MAERRLAPLGAAVGLIAAGFVATTAGGWVLDDLVQPGRGWMRALTVALGLAILAFVVLRHRPRVGLPLWKVTWSIVVLASGIATLAVFAFFDQYRQGFPGVTMVFVAVGGVAVAVGAVLSLRVAVGPWRRPPILSLVWTIGLVLLVAVVITPLTLVAPGLRLTASTSSSVQPAAVPGTVTQVAWSTEIDGQILDVKAAGAGAIAVLDDRIVALDGVTGQIRWSRHRAGARVRDLEVSPDGRTARVAFSPADRPYGGILREILDTFTGQSRYTEEVVSKSPWLETYAGTTDVSTVRVNDERTQYTGYSLTDGARLWTYHPPAGCRSIDRRSTEAFGVSNGYVLPLGCRTSGGDINEFRYVSVDAATGTQRWQYAVAWTGRSPNQPGFNVDKAADGRLVRLTVDGSAKPDVVLDTLTGAELPAPDKLSLKTAGLGVAGQTGAWKLVDVRSGRVLATPGPVFACALANMGALLSGGAVCNGSDKPVTEFTSAGKLKLSVGTFGADNVRPVTAELGGPYAEFDSGDKFLIVSAPGAVMVATTTALIDGHKPRIVGLR